MGLTDRHGRLAPFVCLIALWLAGMAHAYAGTHAHKAPALTISVTNLLSETRPGAVLALPLTNIWQRRPAWRGRPLAVYLAGQTTRLPTQAYARDGGATPDRLLVQLDMPARATLKLEIRPASAAYKAKINPLFARLVPKRYGDFAWENEQVTFRLYRKPLEAVGQVFSGIDVWSKVPGRHVINAWYARNARGEHTHDPADSYHVDHGDGLDSYAVGHSPGDGGTALWWQGRPVYSRNATRVRITAMGPIRLRFEVDYVPWRAGHVSVTEHKVITLDAGSHFNRQSVTWQVDGARRVQVAAGLAVHAGARVMHSGDARIAVWDTPQKAGAGRIATALIAAPGSKVHFASSHGAAWALFDVADGGRMRFASGAGWAKGDVPDFKTWLRDVRRYQNRWSHPLRVSWPVVATSREKP